MASASRCATRSSLDDSSTSATSSATCFHVSSSTTAAANDHFVCSSHNNCRPDIIVPSRAAATSRVDPAP